MHTSYIYILTNKHHTVLYTGVTSNLVKRIYTHKKHLIPGFTKKYNVDKLIYYEKYYAIADAIQREKQLKKWNRDWKVRLINKVNPGWRFMGEDSGVRWRSPLGACGDDGGEGEG